MSTENKKGNEPAFPERRWMLIGDSEMEAPVPGLTKREYFAAMAMQGLIMRDVVASDVGAAKKAVSFADKLIEELNK